MIFHHLYNVYITQREDADPPTLEPAIQMEDLERIEDKGVMNTGSDPPVLEVGGPPGISDGNRKRAYFTPPSNGEKRAKLDDSYPHSSMEKFGLTKTDDIVEVENIPAEDSVKTPLVTSLIHELGDLKIKVTLRCYNDCILGWL